jgi:hypothetical protein
MGFTIYYRATQPLPEATNAAIQAAASAANNGRTWLSCEPVHFFASNDGHLFGGSKPNFMPHPDDAAAAARENLPDGTALDMLDVLCRLSHEHAVDWEITHEHSNGPVGYIRGGVSDPAVIEQVTAISKVGDMLGDFGIG